MDAEDAVGGLDFVNVTTENRPVWHSQLELFFCRGSHECTCNSAITFSLLDDDKCQLTMS